MIVINAAPVRVHSIGFVTDGEVLGACNPVAIVQIEHGMEDGIIVWNLHDGAVRKNLLDALFKHLPLDGSVKIVRHEKSAAQEIITQFEGLFVGDPPFPY